MTKLLVASALAAVVAVSTASAQTPAASLGTVQIPKGVKADSQPLPAGSYTVRLTGNALEPSIGETPDREQWVEFVQNGKVVGKTVATVVPQDQIREVGKGSPPSPGQARVELLKGNDYIRVWLNKGGTSYLIHLPVTS